MLRISRQVMSVSSLNEKNSSDLNYFLPELTIQSSLLSLSPNKLLCCPSELGSELPHRQGLLQLKDLNDRENPHSPVSTTVSQ